MKIRDKYRLSAEIPLPGFRGREIRGGGKLRAVLLALEDFPVKLSENAVRSRNLRRGKALFVCAATIPFRKWQDELYDRFLCERILAYSVGDFPVRGALMPLQDSNPNQIHLCTERIRNHYSGGNGLL